MHRFRLDDIVRKTIALHRTKRVNMEVSLQSVVKHTLKTEETKANWLNDKLHLLNPEHLLKRGYSITLCNGKVVRSVSGLTAGQKIETRLSDGTVESVVDCYKLL
jgi:exodeoxyribonuclease VII large subunit